MAERLIKDYSSPGRKGYSLPPLEIPEVDMGGYIKESYFRDELKLPEVSEVDVVRHYTALSELNYGVDSGIYPLGSCTMKYNPKRNEDIARIEGLSQLHPYQDEEDLKGSFEFLYELKRDLAEISGMDEMTLQPASGAHGELTGLLIIREYFEDKGIEKSKVIVPDSAHGTNPASAVMAGFDIVHLNLHKTFSTPHGGGGPGSGTVGIKEFLRPYLPRPVLKKDAKNYYWDYDRPKSIGKVHAFYGNYGVLVKAFSYIKTLGGEGLTKTTENAVLNANYMQAKLKEEFLLPYQENSLHEFVLSGVKQKEKGASTLNIAKRLLDYGQYAPTIYFPLVVKEAMMIEPTETENVDTLNRFIETLKKISEEIEKNPELVKNAPHNTSVRKLDEVKAARQPNLRW